MIKKDTQIIMRYRMSDQDVYYGGGVVNSARSITCTSDVETKLMILNDGDMTRFDDPKLVRQEKVTLIVKEDRQRGLPPDGAVKDPRRTPN